MFIVTNSNIGIRLDFGTMIRRPGYGDHLEATIDPGIKGRQSGDAVPAGFEDAVGWLAPVAPGERPHWKQEEEVFAPGATGVTEGCTGEALVVADMAHVLQCCYFGAGLTLLTSISNRLTM